MDRLPNVPLDRLKRLRRDSTTEGVHTRTTKELSRENRKITLSEPRQMWVPTDLVPGGGASAFSTEGGDDTRTRAAS